MSLFGECGSPSPIGVKQCLSLCKYSVECDHISWTTNEAKVIDFCIYIRTYVHAPSPCMLPLKRMLEQFQDCSPVRILHSAVTHMITALDGKTFTMWMHMTPSCSHTEITWVTAECKWDKEPWNNYSSETVSHFWRVLMCDLEVIGVFSCMCNLWYSICFLTQFVCTVGLPTLPVGDFQRYPLFCGSDNMSHLLAVREHCCLGYLSSWFRLACLFGVVCFT